MKWSMFIRDNVTQVNLEAENEHEQQALDVLREHGGSAAIHHGVDVGLCRGGYLRNFGESKALAITIRKLSEGDCSPPPK